MRLGIFIACIRMRAYSGLKFLSNMSSHRLWMGAKCPTQSLFTRERTGNRGGFCAPGREVSCRHADRERGETTATVRERGPCWGRRQTPAARTTLGVNSRHKNGSQDRTHGTVQREARRSSRRQRVVLLSKPDHCARDGLDRTDNRGRWPQVPQESLGRQASS